MRCWAWPAQEGESTGRLSSQKVPLSNSAGGIRKKKKGNVYRKKKKKNQGQRATHNKMETPTAPNEILFDE